MTVTFLVPEVHIELRGGLNDGAADYARQRMNAMLLRASLPVGSVHIMIRRLRAAPHPRVIARAELDVDGRRVVTQVEGESARRAVDLLESATRPHLQRVTELLTGRLTA